MVKPTANALQREELGDEPVLAQSSKTLMGPHPLRAAIYRPYNLVAMAIGVALTASLLSVWPLIIMAAGEILYLVLATRTALAPKVRPSARSSLALHTIETPNYVLSTEHKTEEGRRNLEKIADDALGVYRHLTSLLHLVEIQIASLTPPPTQIVCKAKRLLERYLFFAQKDAALRERLMVLVEEGRQLASASDRKMFRMIQSNDLRNPFSMSLIQAGSEVDREPVAATKAMAVQARQAFEQELEEIAFAKLDARGPEELRSLADRSQQLLAQVHDAEEIGRVLINIHYHLNLIEKKIELLIDELPRRAPDSIVASIDALLLQGDPIQASLARLLQD